MSEYVYGRSSVASERAKNIGWLGPGSGFEIAEPDAELLELLWQYCSISILQTRGLHECHLCAPHASNVAEKDRRRLLLGSAEIRVISRSGVTYAAPNLIYHYVLVHKYRPPDEFVEAVRTGPQPSSAEYFSRLSEMELTWSPTLVPDGEPVTVRFIRTPDGVKKIQE